MNLTRNASRLCPILLLSLFPGAVTIAQDFVNPLRGLGYSLIPAPQETVLTGHDFRVDESWRVISDTGIIALESLIEGTRDIRFSGQGEREIILAVRPGVLNRDLDESLARQGYRLSISSDRVEVAGNGEPGLLYGVQSLLQLMRPAAQGGFTLPEGVITDWPDLPLRMIHWDTKHHQDRLETLKRFLDQAAYFKINAVGFEMEDKYEYPRHQVIGAPGAFTMAEMQELSGYALERYIQIIPVIQAPAHMTYVLKHPEFAHFRADGMNYQACMCDEEAIQLIFDMYQDMIDATPGMDYFHVSTDEIYYAGICDKCPEPYDDAYRSQVWVDFVNRAHDWLSSRGRKMLAWVEYPLLTEDIPDLPEGLLGQVSGSESREWVNNLNGAKIKQFAYSSIQGNEWLFPNYFMGSYRGKDIQGRLFDASRTVTRAMENKSDLVGSFAAAWDDAGLHNETFWLGWATVTQYSWSVGIPELEQSTADFMEAFYGPGCEGFIDDYRLLQEGARYYEDLWDRVVSVERGQGYGNSFGKGIGIDRFDPTLKLPPLPSPGDLVMTPEFNARYADKIAEAASLMAENDQLIAHLQQSLSKVSRNRYNLEVLISIAYLERYTFRTVLNLSSIEKLLVAASAASMDSPRAVSRMVAAHELTGEILKEEASMWAKLTRIWEKSRFEKGRSVGGKEFLHVLDDVKDHFADRRKGLDYMLAPFERMGLKEWQRQLEAIILDYAEEKDVAVVGLKTVPLED
jgi:hexosaminidase